MSIKTSRPLTSAASTTKADEETTLRPGPTDITPADHANYLRAILARHITSNPMPSRPVPRVKDGSELCSLAAKLQKAQKTGDVNHEAEEGLAAIKLDIQKNDKWSEKSVETWKRLFDETTAGSNATESSVFHQMSALAAEINKVIGSNAVGVAATKEANIASYYMTLSRDKATTSSNHLNIAARKESPTVIRLGTFGKQVWSEPVPSIRSMPTAHTAPTIKSTAMTRAALVMEAVQPLGAR